MVESISKTPVGRQQAEAVVDAAFGSDVSLASIAVCDEGWFNAVYRLGLDDGSSCVLKVAPPPQVRVMRYEHDIITTEVDALRVVGDRTDIPVPGVLAWDTSCELIPSAYFLMEECRGSLLSTLRPTLDADEQAEVDAQLARHLRSLHGIAVPAFGRPDATAPKDATWSAAFGRLITDLLADAIDASVELPRAPGVIASLVDASSEHLDAVTTPHFVHWDLWDTNVFVDPTTLRVVGVIDFERVLWADPLMEAQFVTRRVADQLVDAYGDNPFAVPHAIERRRLYDLYLFLVMTVECAYRNYPTDDIEQLARPSLAAVLDERSKRSEPIFVFTVAMASDETSRWAYRETPSDLRDHYSAHGWWNDDTFARFIERRAAELPDLRIRVFSAERPETTTLADLHARADRLAGGLSSRGLGPGDVIAYQLPNWIETLAVLWAGFRVGATMVPIIHFYGPTEVDFILRQSGARALVTCASFGGVSHLANLATIRGGLDDLELVVVVGAEGAAARTVRGGRTLTDLLDASPLGTAAAVDPDGAAMIGYTSGTTADPKGVIHSHRSLLAEVRQLSTIGNPAPTVMASPLAHMTGMLGGSLVPLHKGVPIELVDRWDPGAVLAIIGEHRIGAGGGATIFLTSLLDHPDFTGDHAVVMARMGLGGAPVPVAVADRAEALGIRVTRAYGSTEHPSITGSTDEASLRERTRTDGTPLAGVEIRLVDDDGEAVPVGVPGQILSRGPDLFCGYTDPALTAGAFDGSWYRTGDVGVLDDEGCLTITDRVSDLIIRGGLNLSAAEIESRVATMPGVAEVAVVAVPDERLGERACAVIRLAPGTASPDLGQLCAHLERSGLPRQKWPEQLRVVEDFARTPSGKIKKRDLRAWLREAPA